MIRLLIADSHPQYRQALHQLCEVNGGFTVVAEAETGEQVVRLAHQHRPTVILMDTALPGLSSLETARRVTGENGGVRVIWLTLFGTQRLSSEARQSGVWDMLPKDCDEADLFAAIRSASQAHKNS